MKKPFFWLLMLLSCWTLAAFAEQKQTICLNMIVKNESKVIRRCLASVGPYIDYWVIVDTGSSDGTQDIIREFMKDVPGELHECPWVNFSHNRNEALEFAKGKSDYVLFIDADEELKFSDGFVMPYLDIDCYSFRIEYGISSYKRTQLVNNHLDWKWIGVVHEYIKSPQVKTVETLKGVVNVVRREGCRSQDKDIFLKDAQILEAALKEDPNDARSAFYLAQSYRDAHDFKTALEKYEARVKMGGWDQEIFLAKYEIGRMQQLLDYDTETFTKSYCEAYLCRPTRMEPLFQIASHYRKKGNFFMGFIFSALGLEHPVPDDQGYVEEWIYDYGLLLEHAICTYWIGNYEESLESCSKLLTKPHLPDNFRDHIQKTKTLVLAKLYPVGETSAK
ncbi:MAG: SPBc2 prophage-derived glycosyltransferase SunS [Chlamydiae bacterium]|nr:SPBc2 prophage-derived glycosyltransferase SunS [Chlamydiota bacterium]